MSRITIKIKFKIMEGNLEILFCNVFFVGPVVLHVVL